MTNYKNHLKNVNYCFNNLMDDMHEFSKNQTIETREDVLYRIKELRCNLSYLKASIKDIYIPKKRGGIK